MKLNIRTKLAAAAVTALLAVGAWNSTAADNKIQWTPFSAAMTKAKEANKPVVLDFYATWCGPCKMMDKQTYTDAKVQAALANYIPVKIDVDKDTAAAEKYGIKSIPTTIILDPSGKQVASEVGFIDAKKFTALLQKHSAAKK